MRRLMLAIMLGVLVGGATIGCIAHEGNLALFLTAEDNTAVQSEGALQQLSVEVVRVEVQEADGAFVIIFDGSVVYELIALQGQRALLALGEDLDDGNYTAVRITFSEANSQVVNENGVKKPLRIDGVRALVPALFGVIEDQGNDVMLRFDIDNSLTLKSVGYVLRPVIVQTTSDLFVRGPPVVRRPPIVARASILSGQQSASPVTVFCGSLNRR